MQPMSPAVFPAPMPPASPAAIAPQFGLNSLSAADSTQFGFLKPKDSAAAPQPTTQGQVIKQALLAALKAPCRPGALAMNAFMSTAAMIATAIIPPHIHALATFPATFIMIAMIDAAFAFQRVLKQGKTPTV